MPEGDTVYRAAAALDRALSGRVLDRTDFRVPALATVDLSGGTVEATASRGKHLLTRIRSGETTWTLHTHLRMDGHWSLLRSGARWRHPAHEARVVLESGDVQAVGFLLADVRLVPTDSEEDLVGHLGPDLLGHDWDPDEAVRRLLGDPERTIGEALLDQRHLAGIGNVFRAELCFVSGLHPRTPVGAVPTLPRVVRRAHQMLDLNKARGTRITTGDRRRPLWVYRLDGSPCRRCGTTILVEMLGPPGRERASYWCPHCQPAPT